MQQIICRFDDGPTFLRHLDHQGSDGAALRFFGDCALRCDEVIRISIIIDAPGERHDLHMRITGRTATVRDGDPEIGWHYRAVITDADAPWLEMLVRKFDTADRFRSLIA